MLLSVLLLFYSLSSLRSRKQIANGFLSNPLSRIMCLTRCIRWTASATRREARAFVTLVNAIS
jgi:hypothetical protein